MFSLLSLLPPLLLYASLIIQRWQFLLSSASSDPGMLWPGLGSLLPPRAWWRVQPPGLLFAYSSLCGSCCISFVSFKGYTDLGNSMRCSPDLCFETNIFFPQYQCELLNNCNRSWDEHLSGCGFTAVCDCTDLRSMPPNREALRHSGGDSLLFTSAMVTLYLEVELSRDNRPGTEQNKSVGFTTHVPPAGEQTQHTC